jgi:hypothetical protein
MRHCAECGEPTEHPATAEPILCPRCYNRLHPRFGICAGCGQHKRTHGVDGYGHAICGKCYRDIFLTEVCVGCDQAKGVAHRAPNGDAFCASCYCNMRIPVECGSCHRMKPRHTKHIAYGDVCKVCHNRIRRSEDSVFALVANLRSRVRSAFRRFGQGGKIRPSREYGIDYMAIAEHIGSCPGLRSEYHIDHVFPLAAFDFAKPGHIRAAFAPDNHQWLSSRINLSKGDTYDRDAFKDYLARHGVQ